MISSKPHQCMSGGQHYVKKLATLFQELKHDREGLHSDNRWRSRLWSAGRPMTLNMDEETLCQKDRVWVHVRALGYMKKLLCEVTRIPDYGSTSYKSRADNFQNFGPMHIEDQIQWGTDRLCQLQPAHVEGQGETGLCRVSGEGVSPHIRTRDKIMNVRTPHAWQSSDGGLLIMLRYKIYC